MTRRLRYCHISAEDLGELWTWGGSDHWYEIEPDAWQTLARDTTSLAVALVSSSSRPPRQKSTS